MKNLAGLVLLLFFLFLLPSNAVKAADSSRIRISLLTCSPGEELYSIFGHSAIRIIDSNSVTDYVYNYGTFNFEDEDFYLKFARGKLLYFVSLERTDDFLYFYTTTGRGIKEQELNLNAAEKKSIQAALNENLREENRYYKYDFFLDNCTTRLRDIIKNQKQPTPAFPFVMPEKTRFRQSIHQYLEKGGKLWSELGIDLVLGLPTDKIMTAEEQEFLPDNLMRAVDSCKNTSLVEKKNTLYEPPLVNEAKNWLSPMLVFSLFTLICFAISRIKNNLAIVITIGIDRLLFFSTGFLGIVLLFMWMLTDHSMTKDNFNLFWAMPLNVIACFYTTTSRRFFKGYFLCYALLLTTLILSWSFLPQDLNNALLPIVLLLAYRSYMIYKSPASSFKK